LSLGVAGNDPGKNEVEESLLVQQLRGVGEGAEDHGRWWDSEHLAQTDKEERTNPDNRMVLLAQNPISVTLRDDRQRSCRLEGEGLLAFLVEQLQELMKVFEPEIVISNEERTAELQRRDRMCDRWGVSRRVVEKKERMGKRELCLPRPKSG
jgi:hypothetical protein